MPAPSRPCSPDRRRRALLAAAAGAVILPAPGVAATCPTLLAREFLRLQDEKPQNLCQYAGQVLVVVNTASFCGYTPQYRSLEALYERYRARGLVVLGFPSNDFGAQEPGSDREIAAFCENTFGVRFPMFTKSRVTRSAGAEVNPLIGELAQRTGQWPRWNFHKYLIGRDASSVTSLPSELDPGDRRFSVAVESLLDAK